MELIINWPVGQLQLKYKNMKFFANNQLDGIDPEKEAELAAAEEAALREEALEELKGRFGHSAVKKSWLSRNHPNRVASHKFSYVFNVISALAGLYGARILLQMLPVPIPYFDWAMAIISLYYLEKAKRKFSDKFWDAYFATGRVIWGYAMANFGMLVISLLLSLFGAYFGSKDFSPEAKYIGGGDSIEVVALQDQYKKIESDKQKLMDDPDSYNSKGQFYHKLMDEKAAYSLQMASIQAELKDKHGIITLQNEDILTDWKLRNAFRGNFSIFITLLSEILFEICMAFASYYDARYCLALIASEKKPKRRETGKVATLAA